MTEMEGSNAVRAAPRRRIALSGASGFIGTALQGELVKRGYEVMPVRRFELEQMRAGADGAGRLAGCDAAIHLAARAHVLRESEDDPLAVFRVANRDTTLAFARACAMAGVRRFAFVSSIGVNGGASRRPFRSDDTPAPEEPYAVSKLEAEHVLWESARETGIEVVIIRPPLVYGPHVKGNFLRLLKLAAAPVPLPLASISGKRSFIGVWNLADLLICCIEHPNAPGRTFLAGDGEDIALPDLIRQLAAAMGRSVRLFAVPEDLMRQLTRIAGIGREYEKLASSLLVDTSETRRVLGWTAPVSLGDGLARTARWYFESRSRR